MPGPAASGDRAVRRLALSPASPAPSGADAALIRTILANATRHALIGWWSARGYDRQPAGSRLDLGGTDEEAIRSPASVGYALATSVALAADDADPDRTLLDRAREMAVRLVRSVAGHHRAVESGGWGDAWQSALWAALAGTAGWLLWDALDGRERDEVLAMVESEADRFLGWQVEYWKDRAGRFLRPCGDTAGEESAWNARLLFLATAMLPHHHHHAEWAVKGAELAIGAYATPRDLADHRPIRGRPLTDWLAGTNAEDDGGFVNHDRYHPDYVATITEMMAGGLVAALAGEPIPLEAIRGAGLEYRSLIERAWWPAPERPCPDGPAFVRPGPDNPRGTVYVPSSGAIHYPQGTDWGPARRANFMNLDTLVAAYDIDGLAEEARGWARRHGEALLAMQTRPLVGGALGDGRTYRAVDEDTYPLREEWVAAQAADMWLATWLVARDGTLTMTDAPLSIRPDVEASRPGRDAAAGSPGQPWAGPSGPGPRR
jgi:hypothetical protein